MIMAITMVERYVQSFFSLNEEEYFYKGCLYSVFLETFLIVDSLQTFYRIMLKNIWMSNLIKFRQVTFGAFTFQLNKKV